MTSSALLRLGACIAAIVCVTVEASAQEPPARPYNGLFGGNERDPNRRQSLDLTISVEGAHDDNVLAEADTPDAVLDPRLQVRGIYSDYALDLAYARRSAGNAVQFGARASGDMRQTAAVAALSRPSYNGAVGVTVAKTRGRLSFDGQQRVSYFPYRIVSMLPRLAPEGVEELVAGPGIDFAIASRPTYGSQGDARITVRLGRRTSWDVGYSSGIMAHAGASERYIDHAGRSAFMYRMTSHATLRLGYGHRLTSYSGAPDARYVHSRNIDAGIDYNRALSFSRRTTVSFTTGTTGTSDGVDDRYYATGGAALTHDIGRSWHADALFRREVSFIEGVPSPYLASGATLALGGYIGRRMDMVLSAGYTDAFSNHPLRRSSFVSYTGAARLRVALSRWGSAYVQYFHYDYRFGEEDADIAALPPSLERDGVRGGLTFWLPLLR